VGRLKIRGKKATVSITLPPKLVEKSRKYGLNISKIAENALKDAIERMEQPKTLSNGEKRLEKAQMVRGVGFEPTNLYRIGASVLRL
jgi:post-segregation antitoxin (ccd killing protein)